MPFSAWVDERERALESLCIGKVKKMDLGNHKTAWFALQNLPEPEPNSGSEATVKFHTIVTLRQSILTPTLHRITSTSS